VVETKNLIETLRRLQGVDRKIAHIERMKAWEPKRLAEAEEKAAAAENLLAQLDEQRSEIQRKVARIELDIKEREEKIARHKSQMLSASSNRQYQALLHEISMEEVEKARVEEALLEEMIKLDGFSQREKDAEAAIEESNKDLDRVKKEVAASLKEIARDEEVLRRERDAIASQLPDDTVRQYTRLFKSRSGSAVVPANYVPASGRTEGRYTCGGCNISLTHQMVNLLLIGNEVVHCKSCGRILFMDEQSKGEE